MTNVVQFHLPKVTVHVASDPLDESGLNFTSSPLKPSPRPKRKAPVLDDVPEVQERDELEGSQKGKGKATAPAMFPPMDLLAASGRSIVDLETVSTLPPWYKNERGIIGALSSLALGITVSSNAIERFIGSTVTPGLELHRIFLQCA